MVKIRKIKARQITDSRRKPTVEVELVTDLGAFKASVPSGVSTGKYEAVELRDKDGGMKKAIKNIEKIIAPVLVKEDLTDQKRIDEILIKLDGTKNKSRLGANAILAVSMACCRAGAKAKGLPLWQWLSKISGSRPKLPSPALLQIEGGLHSKKGTSIQEFMTVFSGVSFSKSFHQGMKIYHSLRKILVKKYGKTAIKPGLEGAFAPPIKKTEEVLDLIVAAAGKTGLKNRVKIILDAAASHSRSKKTPGYYLNLAKNYPILGIEDPFSQDDWRNWQILNSKLKIQNSKLLIIADDLTVTNPERIRWTRQKKLCNTVVIKPNQIGTISETITAAKLAKSYGWKIMVSHRSGETKDDFIADLAVGIGADFIKSGAPLPKERMVKYNQLLKIEKEIKKHG